MIIAAFISFAVSSRERFSCAPMLTTCVQDKARHLVVGITLTQDIVLAFWTRELKMTIAAHCIVL
jgi:hypothetical protein